MVNKQLKILVLYSLAEVHPRKTIEDHLYSFGRYLEDCEVHYCNVLVRLPSFLTYLDYDGVILHYTLLSLRWTPSLWSKALPSLKKLKRMQSVKIAMPQDEYAHTDALCDLMREAGIQTVYTCAYPIDYQTLYPKEKTGLQHYFTTLTGFVDEQTLSTLENKEKKPREIAIGYRARKLPYWLGKFGQLKWEVGEKFQQAPMKTDISTRPEDVFLGDQWLEFILNCKTMIGCLGGASLHDPTGELRNKVEDYVEKHPQATFEETEAACFQGQDHSLSLFALSPRHFECAMAKTCQVLVEGDYHGVFKPGVHYIEVKKDFSNLPEVFAQVEDSALCEQLAENAYRDVVMSGQYTYRKFVGEIADHIRLHTPFKRGVLKEILFKCASFYLFLRKKGERGVRFIYRRFYL